jgi:peroxiredoxin
MPGSHPQVELRSEVATVAGTLKLRTILFNAALTLILVGLLAFNYQQEKLAREDAVNTQGRPPAIGSQVPEFHMRGESGVVVSFQDLPRQDTLLVLWYRGCEPSTQLLQALHELGAQSALRILPVSIADSVAEVKEFFQEKGWNFPVFADSDKSTKWAFKASISPAVYLIDKEGRIVYRQLGSSKQGFDYIVNALERL